MDNMYLNLKEQHQRELEEFPWFVAFDEKQFSEGMKKLGLNPEDMDKIMSVPPGIIIKKDDEHEYYMMHHRWNEEHMEAIENDVTGFGYVYDMFSSELREHEYDYTADVTDAVESSGFSLEMIATVPKLHRAFEFAKMVVSKRIISEELMDCPILLYESKHKNVKYYLTHESAGKFFLSRYERSGNDFYVNTREIQCKNISEVRDCIQKEVEADNLIEKGIEQQQSRDETLDLGDDSSITKVLAEDVQEYIFEAAL